MEEAYSAALQELPRHLPTHGLEPVGIDDLRVAIADRFTDRGLPTSPDAIMVTSGAQHALRLLLGLVAAPGDRALVDHPTYPNALEAMRRGGVRPVPVAVRPENPGSAWDLVALRSAARQSGARMAYLIPDFHNPTGACLGDAGRAELAALARESGMMLVVDETMVDLWLDAPPPAPVASFASGSAQRDVVTIGSAAKSFWGGLRIGWIRADPELVNRLAGARAAVDLGTPVVDQLAAAYLVRRDGGLLDERRALLRDQRSVLLDALGLGLPDWEVSPGPGGLSTWVRMPGPVSSALAAAAPAHGVVLAAGPRFGVEGAFERFVRLPYARPADDLRLGVERLARAYEPLRGAAEHAPALVV
nr:PLP-dependent aminotransferase family protein [Rhodococcus rhodnii]